MPYSDSIRTHLDEILNGTSFNGSRRSQEFLSHVVECALAGQWERLKERSLGIDVFSRSPSYDTGGDSIVRVTASDVRKRLLQHYSECPPTRAFRIEIPAGSYIPEFSGLKESAATVAPSEVAVTAPAKVSVAPTNGASQPFPVNASSARHRSFRVIALAVLAVLCGWVLGLTSARFIFGRPERVASRFEFYQELLGPIATDPAHETEIALSNPQLSLYVGSNDLSSSSAANTRVPPELEKALSPPAKDRQPQFRFHYLTHADSEYTEVGDAISAFNLSQLMRSLGRSPRLTESRFVNWGAMRNVHVILLGTPQMKAWTHEGLDGANFTMEHDSIVNAHPLPGELPTYDRSVKGKITEDYGLIWMVRSPSGLRHVLMAGLTGAGTAGVSDFFCDPDRMRPIYEQLRAASKNDSIASEWQVLLHVHARENVPLQISFVSLRVGGLNR